MTTRVEGLACPNCGYEYDSVIGVSTPYSPKEGDISICVRCGEVTQFTYEGGPIALREVDIEELKAIYEEHPEILYMQQDRRAALRGALDNERNQT